MFAVGGLWLVDRDGRAMCLFEVVATVVNLLYCYNATRDGLEPFYTKSIYEMVTHIFNLVKDCNGTANLNFGYAKGSLSKSKTKKLAMLLKEGSQTCDFNLLSRWITLLI